MTDYDLLLDNINGLKSGKDVDVPVYDFKLSRRVGYRFEPKGNGLYCVHACDIIHCLTCNNGLSFFCRSVKVPPSRIVVIEGIYALSEKLRPLLDMRVAVRGGVHFDLVKRVLRDINRAGQDPEEIIQQISETVHASYFCMAFSYTIHFY